MSASRLVKALTRGVLPKRKALLRKILQIRVESRGRILPTIRLPMVRTMGDWVGPAPINSNHRDPAPVVAPDLDVTWSDGRQDAETRAEHGRRMRHLHKTDPAYHRSALRGLDKGRRQRRWSDEDILAAIRGFHTRAGRWPGQPDFRSANGLPGVGTVQRRYGSHVFVVQQARNLRSPRGHPERPSG